MIKKNSENVISLIELIFTGPPGSEGIGLPGRPGDKGEAGRPGITLIGFIIMKTLIKYNNTDHLTGVPGHKGSRGDAGVCPDCVSYAYRSYNPQANNKGPNK